MAFTINCPLCGHECAAGFIDNGVGDHQVSPFFCVNCDWEEQWNEGWDIEDLEGELDGVISNDKECYL